MSHEYGLGSLGLGVLSVNRCINVLDFFAVVLDTKHGGADWTDTQ
jgi:hypothetical protein